MMHKDDGWDEVSSVGLSLMLYITTRVMPVGRTGWQSQATKARKMRVLNVTRHKSQRPQLPECASGPFSEKGKLFMRT
jgi:hypothetical protein